MSKIGKAMRRGLQAAVESLGPGAYRVGGRRVRCPHCDGEEFARKQAALDTHGTTFSDWATALVCSNCTGVQWFRDAPARDT